MATFNKFDTFAQDLGEGVHDLSTDTLKVYLSNTTPSASGDSVKADLAEISAGNGYTAGGNDVQNVFTGGQLTATDIVITATGAVGPFQYVVLYNDDATDDPLIGWWALPSAVTLANQDTFTIDFAATLLTIS